MIFNYVSGELRSRGATRVYRSACGRVGLAQYPLGSVSPAMRYFVWTLPDSAPEYATWSEALAAAEAEAEAESVRQC